MDYKNELEEHKHKTEHVKSVTGTPGWKYVNEHFENIMIALIEKLLYCEDMSEVKRLQERFRAFYSMIEYFDNNDQLNQHYQEQLVEVMNFEEFNTEYALNQ